MKTRTATITDIVQNEGRRIGYIAARDSEGVAHHFNNGSINGALKHALSVGDQVTIEWTTGPGYGFWYIKK